MSPLSALRLPMMPQDIQSLVQQGTSGIGKSIPAQELEKLAPSSMPQSAGVSGTGNSFSGMLGNMVSEVNSKQMAAGDAVNGLLSGGNVSLHQAMIAMEEANVSFQLMIEVRNKLLESYQEMMRMQV